MEKFSSGVPVIRGEHLLDSGRISQDWSDYWYVSKDYASQFPKTELAEHDIVMSVRGSVGQFARVGTSHIGAQISPNTIRISPDPARIWPPFLFFAMKADAVGHFLQGTVATSAVPGLKASDIKSVPFKLPSLIEQQRIAEILGSLDDKIELSRRMNETLEAMARALFQSWFVDFDPVRARLDGRKPDGMDASTAALFPAALQDSPLGPIPKGWGVSKISEIADVVDCLHSKKPERVEKGRLYLQLNNIGDDGLLDTLDAFLVSENDYLKWITRMEGHAGDCVITNVGRVGAVAQIPEGITAALGRNMTGIRCKSLFPFPTFLIECLLSEAMREEIVKKMDSGTILDALNVKSIPHLRFVRPTVELAQQFERIARPFRKKMEENMVQSRTLAALRDALLPKLLSGELRVSHAEKAAYA